MSFPTSRYLVPEVELVAPEGWTTVEQRILGGLPVQMDLSKTLRIRLVVPTGLAREWRAMDSAAIVSDSEREVAPHLPDPAAGPMDLRLAGPLIQVRASGVRVGVLPLRVAHVLQAANDGEAAASVEIMVLGWRLCAGNLRGTGDYGSFIKLAWREADRAVSQFGTPPISEFVHRRLPPMQRIESKLGLRVEYKLQRFSKRRGVLR